MARFLLLVGIAVAAVLIIVLALALTKPARFTIQRSIVIQATPEKVFALINDLHRWSGWSAGQNEDPKTTRSFSGAPAGKGAIAEWEGTGSTGKGRLEIIESSSNLIRVQADWARPFKARNINLFAFESQGNSIRVTWTLDGENVFVLKVITIFVTHDRLMGSHFDQSLAALKSAAEK